MRIVERDWAVTEIADAIRDRQHWIVGATPQTVEHVSDTTQARLYGRT